MVGARRASSYGRALARELGRELAAAGLVVVSGLAFGIDACAHRGALEAGRTVAVLGCGADVAYPAAHRSLWRRIQESGLVLSELPPGTGAWRWSFPARNRIMAALAAMTVVVEAAERSGSLITADLAADLGRDLGAVPGPVNSRVSAGPNNLLAGGACLVRDAQDVLDATIGPGIGRVVRTGPALESLAAEALAALEGEQTPATRWRVHCRSPGRPRPPFSPTSRPRATSAAPCSALTRGRCWPCPPVSRVFRMDEARVPAVLSVAGSDSGGGAGIQADLKAFARCGVHGMTAITAITAQNTRAVEKVEAVSSEMVFNQILAIAEDMGADAVKIGMLGSAATIDAVAVGLTYGALALAPVVIDPVMVAESGAALIDDETTEAMVAHLFPRCDVATPNIPEARVLTGAGEGASQEELAHGVLELGPKAVVVTGGHSEELVDVFFDGEQVVEIPGDRYPIGASHGSGCTHSSVLAARLALGDSPLDAARVARRIASESVRDGLRDLGAGAGPVNVFGHDLGAAGGLASGRPR